MLPNFLVSHCSFSSASFCALCAAALRMLPVHRRLLKMLRGAGSPRLLAAHTTSTTRCKLLRLARRLPTGQRDLGHARTVDPDPRILGQRILVRIGQRFVCTNAVLIA